MNSQFHRRDFLKLLGLSSAAAGLSQPLSRKIPSKRYNVLFILTDDQRFDTIHGLGNEQAITPNMDHLVQEGTVFSNAYIMGGTSGAVCMPSRAMILSGRNLFSLKNRGETIPQEHVMLGEVFRRAGYTTCGIGKWHNGTQAYARCFTTGGPILFRGMSDQYNPPLMDFDERGVYDHAKTYLAQDRPDLKGKHSSEIYTDAALEFLRQQPKEVPFFLYLALQSPHDPRTAPPDFHALFNPEAIPTPDAFLPEHPFRIGDDRVRDELLAPYPRTPEIVRRHTADYLAMISHDDHQMGRIMSLLKERGLYEKTIIVITGDNGLALGRHGLFGKQNVYDHSVHVPLILAGPGIRRGRRLDALCYLFDIYPTLCDLCGLKVPESVQGLSLVGSLQGKPEHRDALLFAYKNYERAYRDRRWKLILFDYKGEKHTMLFDLSADIHELRNLAERPEYHDTVAKLTHRLQTMAKSFGDCAQWDQPGFGLPNGEG